MKTIIFYLLLLLSCGTLFGQNFKFPNDVKKGDIFVQCIDEEGKKGEMIKVIKNPSKSILKDIQFKLKQLNYNLKISGVFDERTKQIIFEFNNDECNICTNYITEKTVTVLNKLYKISLRLERRIARLEKKNKRKNRN